MKEEEKALLSFTDKDGNKREIFEKDLTDRVQPLVEEIQQYLKAEQELTKSHDEATKDMHHMQAVRTVINYAVEKLEATLPPYKKPVKIQGVDEVEK
jgi:16S rRNA C1402 N4-methylase RsmH